MSWVFSLWPNLVVLCSDISTDATAGNSLAARIAPTCARWAGNARSICGRCLPPSCSMGLRHPPLGMVLFVLARVARLSVERTTMAILPWLVPLLAALIAITYVPELTLWLPRVMGVSK